jgi:hypothetical protein
MRTVLFLSQDEKMFHHVFFVFVIFLLVPVLSAVIQIPAGQLAVGLKTEH